MIIFFLILTTLIDQLCDKSIYRPYLRLMTGFMLISLMMQPVSYYLSNEDIVTQAISTAVKGENNPAFLDGAKEEKQNQIKEQITTLFSQYDLKVLDVDSKVNEKGTIEKIDIKTDKLRHTKKLKTAISNFYNMKESNINISEQKKYDREGKTTTSDRKYRHSKTLPDLTSWHQPDHRKHPIREDKEERTKN